MRKFVRKLEERVKGVSRAQLGVEEYDSMMMRYAEEAPHGKLESGSP